MELVISGALSRDDIPSWCDRARTLLENDDCPILVCDVRGLSGCDAVAVDMLARVKLIAQRHGTPMCVRAASRDLRDLISLSGLAEILRVVPG